MSRPAKADEEEVGVVVDGANACDSPSPGPCPGRDPIPDACPNP